MNTVIKGIIVVAALLLAGCYVRPRGVSVGYGGVPSVSFGNGYYNNGYYGNSYGVVPSISFGSGYYNNGYYGNGFRNGRSGYQNNYPHHNHEMRGHHHHNYNNGYNGNGFNNGWSGHQNNPAGHYNPGGFQWGGHWGGHHH